MPSWKKVAVSGSDASFNSILATTNVVAQSFTGSLFGTASQAIQTQTASYVNPLTQSVYLSGSLDINSQNGNLFTATADTLIFTGSMYTTGGVFFQGLPSASTNYLVGYDETTGRLSYQSTSSVASITSSFAVSSSYAVSASYASASSFLNGQTAYVNEIFPTSGNSANRIFLENNTGFGATGSIVIYTSAVPLVLSAGAGTEAVQITGSLNIQNGATGSFSGSFSGSLLGSASYAFNSTSASYAATASHADIFTIGGSQMQYSNVPSTSAGANGIFATNTGSFAGAFYQYTLFSGSNARSENATAVWTPTTSSYTNYSTIDVGSTSGVVASVTIVSGQIQLNILTPTAGWTVRAVATYV
jgi:hypothetical protein